MSEKTKARTKANPEANVALNRMYEFTLILDADEITDEMANRLYEAGCDDASLARQAGKTELMFDRIAPSYLEAVVSAVRDAHKAGYHVARVEADDLLTQADIARKIGKSRQMVSFYIVGKRGPGGFPAPESRKSGDHLLWRWSKVAAWLARNNLAGEGVADEAAVAENVNFILGYQERRRLEPKLFDDIETSIFEPTAVRAAKVKTNKQAVPV
jgi:hypothetical protein